MLKLLGRQTSGNVQKVIFMLEEAEAPYVREDYGRQFGNTLTDAYRALNPTAKVPTLIDGDVVVWESNTILRYLAGTRASALTGATPAERSEVERWMDFLLASVNPGYVTVFVESKKPAAERAPDFAAKAKDLAEQMGLLERHLAGRVHFALDRLTIADIAMGPILRRCLGFELDRPALPNLDRWCAAIGERPAFQVAVGDRASTLAG